MKSSRAGFTLVEMMVVLALIVAMTSMAVGAFGAFLSSKQVQLGTKLIGNAYRTGRQYAISNRVPCLVGFDAPKLANAPPSADRDLVRVIPFKTVIIPETGELRYQMSKTSIYEKGLPGKLEFKRLPFEQADATATPPKGILVDIDTTLTPPETYEDLWGIIFRPDGSASETDQSVTETGVTAIAPKNTVDIYDPISTERARVYVFPSTGYTREFYYQSIDQ